MTKNYPSTFDEKKVEHVNLSKTNRLDAYQDEKESFHRSLALRFMELASEIDD
jgi:hypothetical protein